ncbi:MAG: hypothetical protein AAGH70_13660, partial [Pseudomonadota bacterium]
MDAPKGHAVAPRADVSVAISIVLKGVTGDLAIGLMLAIKDRDVWLHVVLNQPDEDRAGPIAFVRTTRFGRKADAPSTAGQH